MRNVILAIALVVLASVAVAASTDYTLTPWQYGVVAWVQGEPNIATLRSVEKAVADVFSFWHELLPESADTWSDLSEMQKGTWAASKYDPFTAGFVPIPSPDASKMWAVPLPSWNGEKILPLTLLIASNRSLVESLAGRTAGAAFSYRSLTYKVLSLNPYYSLAMLMSRSDSVVLNYNSPDLRHNLDHELSHWLTNLICQRNALTMQDVPRLLGEGFAEYTAFRLSGENRNWRISAAVWAEDGHGLSDVPFYMLYPVGTSLVSFLVEKDGVDGFIERFPDLVANWDLIIPDITPAWQAWTMKYKVNEAGRAYAEAIIEQLTLCGMVLQPILSEEATRSCDGCINSVERCRISSASGRSSLPQFPNRAMMYGSNCRNRPTPSFGWHAATLILDYSIWQVKTSTSFPDCGRKATGLGITIC